MLIQAILFSLMDKQSKQHKKWNSAKQYKSQEHGKNIGPLHRADQ
jgi:hypothetical protein